MDESIDILHRVDRIAIACPRGSIARVGIARTFATRFVGLLARTALAADEGLLFVPGGSIHTCGMRCTIDIVFLSAQMRVLCVATSVRPWRFVLAPRGTRFVLEMASGGAQAKRVMRDSVLRVSPITNNSGLQSCS